MHFVFLSPSLLSCLLPFYLLVFFSSSLCFLSGVRSPFLKFNSFPISLHFKLKSSQSWAAGNMFTFASCHSTGSAAFFAIQNKTRYTQVCLILTYYPYPANNSPASVRFLYFSFFSKSTVQTLQSKTVQLLLFHIKQLTNNLIYWKETHTHTKRKKKKLFDRDLPLYCCYVNLFLF